MLVFWTGANKALLNKVVGEVLETLDPPPAYKQIDVGEQPYVPLEGEVCLVMGAKRLDILKQAGVCPKNRALTTLRGRVFDSGLGGHYLLTFDPAILDQKPSQREEIRWDVRLAERFMRTGSLEPEVGEYAWVNDLSGLVAYVEKHGTCAKPVDIGFDTETLGLYPWYDSARILSLQFCPEEGVAIAYKVPEDGKLPYSVWADLNWFLHTPAIRVRMANGKFDLVWIAEKWGIECTNFKADTLLIGSLLDENRSNSLNTHAKLFTTMGGYDDSFDAKYDKGHMDLVPDDDMLVYACGDADATLRTSNVLLRKLKDDKRLARFYVKLLQPAARAFEKIERRGVLVDVERYYALGEELDKEIASLEKQAIKLLPRQLRAKYKDNLSISRPAILQDYFFSAYGLNLKPKVLTDKTKKPSTAHNHLQMFGDHPKAATMCGLLHQLNVAKKIKSTYVDGFLKHLRPDGRLHPTYFLFAGNAELDADGGTVTGRLSAKDPAIQTLVKRGKWAKPLRRCYPAPPGMVAWQADYSQVELRLVACIACEPNMIKAYKEGIDLHAKTAAAKHGYKLEDFMALEEENPDKFEALRYGGKAGNFGLCYGISPAGFVIYAWDTFGLKITLEEATKDREAFFQTYPGLLTWHSKYRNLVHKQGFVRSPLGRIRHLPHIYSSDREIRAKAERQAINSPVQATGSDLPLLAAGLWEAEPENQKTEVEIVGGTHDSLYGYVPEDGAVERLAPLKHLMENLPVTELFGWKPQLSFPVDMEIGPTLADLKKVKIEMKEAA